VAQERLQKIIAHAGVASRRKAEELIVQGQVRVNGQVVTELGTKADLNVDHIKVNGKLIHAPHHLVYLALNKPVGFVTTMSDPEGRRTVVDLVRGVKERVYPVGRLDFATEGLILMTNDGELANAITSAKNQVPKTYVAKVTGTLTHDQEEKFRTGIPLNGRRTAPAELKLLQRSENPWYEVKLIEGRQNQIRIMFQHLGVLVEKLKRVKVGFLPLDVKPGEWRHLKPIEVARFYKQLGLTKKTEASEDDDDS
jgi:23S rRNA pseudouridine2605 synthase